MEYEKGIVASDLSGAAVSRDVGRNQDYLSDSSWNDPIRPVKGVANLSMTDIDGSGPQRWMVAHQWNAVLASAVIGGIPNYDLGFDSDEERRRLTYQEDVACWVYCQADTEAFDTFRTLYFDLREMIDLVGPVEICAMGARSAMEVELPDSLKWDYPYPVELWMLYDDEAMNYTMCLADPGGVVPAVLLRPNGWPVGRSFGRKSLPLQEKDMDARVQAFQSFGKERRQSGSNLRLIMLEGITKKLLAYRWILAHVAGVPMKWHEFGDYFDAHVEQVGQEVERGLEKRHDDGKKRRAQ